MWKTGDEKGLRGEREIHPSMVTQDELFLTGGVFASVQDDSDRDGGISSLLLCLRDAKGGMCDLGCHAVLVSQCHNMSRYVTGRVSIYLHSRYYKCKYAIH